MVEPPIPGPMGLKENTLGPPANGEMLPETEIPPSVPVKVPTPTLPGVTEDKSRKTAAWLVTADNVKTNAPQAIESLVARNENANDPVEKGFIRAAVAFSPVGNQYAFQKILR